MPDVLDVPDVLEEGVVVVRVVAVPRLLTLLVIVVCEALAELLEEDCGEGVETAVLLEEEVAVVAALLEEDCDEDVAAVLLEDEGVDVVVLRDEGVVVPVAAFREDDVVTTSAACCVRISRALLIRPELEEETDAVRLENSISGCCAL